jgi:hypothetical protein
VKRTAKSSKLPPHLVQSRVRAKQRLVERTVNLVADRRKREDLTLKECEMLFWSQVEISESGCWNWKGGRISNRYGTFSLGGKGGLLAHRVSWLFTFGIIPSGLKCLHECDNGFCVRPDHLFIGTQTDNMQDMLSKGRDNYANGSTHPMAKMTREQIIKLRKLASTGGYVDRELSKMFGIARSVVNKIRNRKLWSWVK